jgi:hypothetical protein
MQSSVAWAKAADYAARAEEVSDDNARVLFAALHASWTRMARNWEDMEAEQESSLRPEPPHAGRALR